MAKPTTMDDVKEATPTMTDAMWMGATSDIRQSIAAFMKDYGADIDRAYQATGGEDFKITFTAVLKPAINHKIAGHVEGSFQTGGKIKDKVRFEDAQQSLFGGK